MRDAAEALEAWGVRVTVETSLTASVAECIASTARRAGSERPVEEVFDFVADESCLVSRAWTATIE